MLMPIEHMEDWDKRLARQDAVWNSEVIDRPVVCIAVQQKNPDFPYPAPKTYASPRDRWIDADSAAEWALAYVMNTCYLGDALPHAWPNLGPDVFAALYGCPLEFADDTSWSSPILHNWDAASEISLRDDSPYLLKIQEMTDALLEVGRGRFYTGVTDLHPGGDAIAAFRGPQELSTDLIEYPEEVKAILGQVTRDYLHVFEVFHRRLASANQAISNWSSVVSSRKWYMASNDFSCMISKAMFDEFFLPGIAEECRHMEASAYHLDGPGALRHLDSLLTIPELHLIQWVYGAGNGRATDWLHVYQKCQKAGRAVEIHAEMDELELLMENLRPEGVWLEIHGVPDVDTAKDVIKRVSRWK